MRGAGRGGGARAASNLDGGTVHIELAVANLVDPRPSKRVLTCGYIFGHSDREFRTACERSVGRVVDVSYVGRTSSDIALNDLPLAVLCRSSVSSDGKLAGTASVNSRTVEFDWLGLSCVPLIHLGDLIHVWALLARKVCCFQQRRAVE